MDYDLIADEVISINTVQDMLDGRKQALRSYVFSIINEDIKWNNQDTEYTSGYIHSPEFGVNLSKEVSGGKLVIDISLLEKVLDGDQFRSVVNHIVIMKTVNTPDGNHVETTESYYELNEDALEKQLQLSNIGMEQILKSSTKTKTKTAFYVRKTNKTEV